MTDASELITADIARKAAEAYETVDGYPSERGMAVALRAVLPALIRQAREDERERAARIADEVAQVAENTFKRHPYDDVARGEGYSASRIAAAIRSTEPTP